MAQRRMISLKIIDSARFMKMPVSSQLLYFHMAIRADDDGVVEGYNVMRMVGATEDDLKVLCAKGFVTVLNEDLVAFINDWREHNFIRADRKVDSIYKDLLLQIVPHADLLGTKERADRKKPIPIEPVVIDVEEVDNGTSQGQPEDSQGSADGQHRLGKVRLGKDSVEEDKKDNAVARQSNDIKQEFESLWSLYPRKQGKANALKAYTKARKGKPEVYKQVENGINAYVAYIKAKKIELRYIKQGSTWFNQRCWEDDYTLGDDAHGQHEKPVRNSDEKWGTFGLNL